jgi:hypothetical protein
LVLIANRLYYLRYIKRLIKRKVITTMNIIESHKRTMKANNIMIIIGLIVFGLIAYEFSPLIHETINRLISSLNAFNIIADSLKIN